MAASIATCTGEAIEVVYKKLTAEEHVWQNPNVYIGSLEEQTTLMWVFEDNKMVHRSISYVPGLYRIFDEILVNASDHKQRDPTMDCIKVDIDIDENLISVYNNGKGVPVVIDEVHNVFIPEMLFGHMFASSNFGGNVKKTGGQRGSGAKLTNLFSTKFVIETADGKKQYRQVFSNNMTEKSVAVITDCGEKENWTNVLFKPDLGKFKMTRLSNDVVALMKRRVVDLAGTLGKGVKVELNGTRVPVNTFTEYVNLYLKSVEETRGDGRPLPRIIEKVNNRWEVCVSSSDGEFQHVSFVNGISTTDGSHLKVVTSQITSRIVATVNKRRKNMNKRKKTENEINDSDAKECLWIFANAVIDNPVFSSLTKEKLSTKTVILKSMCTLSKKFLEQVDNSEIVKTLSLPDFQQIKELKKTDGSRGKNINIPKLEDANEAGGKNSDKCTLILTEGDSAKSLVLAGIAVVGRDYYGVFPLKGKILNVRVAKKNKIENNVEIQKIKQILGLEFGKHYDSVKDLRYGSVMVMTDQDHDGSHIKGLLINLFHFLWPSLLKLKGFMVEFVTPIVKASHVKDGTVVSFFTMCAYKKWKQNHGNGGCSIKYYKGLGTSTAEEGKEYFNNLSIHKKFFVWVDIKDDEAIELAFSKAKIQERKDWLSQHEVHTSLDEEYEEIRYCDFINKKFLFYSWANVQRSIPSMVDGLKPGQRKILFCAFKCNLINEMKVAQFSSLVSEKSVYHHGEENLTSTIVGMAQDYAGTNNINLFQPNGQFGTKYKRGKDAASGRYIHTCLSPIARYLFHKDDDLLLDYLDEDGQSTEPAWYIPVIPMVLVNGSDGIGTGWSSYVPNYNPKDVIANVIRRLNDERAHPMEPWYRGFKGLIKKKSTESGTGVSYTTSGVIEDVSYTTSDVIEDVDTVQKADTLTLRITELPIRITVDYSDFLNDLMEENFVKDKKEYHEVTDVVLSKEHKLPSDDLLKRKELENKFKLTTTLSTGNMHLFDSNGTIKKYDTPEHILEDFFLLRLPFYEKRKEVLLDNYNSDHSKLDNIVKFIHDVLNRNINIFDRSREDLFHELHQKEFTPFPKKTNDFGVATADENEEKSSDYEYLLSLHLDCLTKQKIQDLSAEKRKLQNLIEELENTSAKDLWLRDLNALEKQLDELEQEDNATKMLQEEDRKKEVGTVFQGAAVPTDLGSTDPDKSTVVESDDDEDDDDGGCS